MKYIISNNNGFFYSGCCDEYGSLNFHFHTNIKFATVFDDIKDASYICHILNLCQDFFHFDVEFIVKCLSEVNYEIDKTNSNK